MKIVLWPDPRLTKVSAQVTPETVPTPAMLDEMFDTMRRANGVGLSAIQVGVPLRFFILDHSLYEGRAVLVNPVIIDRKGEQILVNEGCLSTPGVFERVRRYPEVRVQYQTPGQVGHSECMQWDATGLMAQAVQHELEHLDGKMFVDHLKPADRSRIMGAMLKYKRSGRR